MHSTDQPSKRNKGRFKNTVKEIFSWFEAADENHLDSHPYIKESKGILALHLDKMSVQSEMKLDAPDELVLGYTRAMMCALLLLNEPKSIAMIGLGGGSLAKYCYRYLPLSKILALEINAGVIALRNEFAIPPDDARFQVRLADGADYVRDNSETVDVLFVDGFDASGQVPQLGTPEFYDDCFAKLNNNGVLAVNLWFGYPNYDKYVARISRSFAGQIAIVDADGDKANKIILAVKQGTFPPSHATLRQRAESLCKNHPMNYQAKADKIIKHLSKN